MATFNVLLFASIASCISVRDMACNLSLTEPPQARQLSHFHLCPCQKTKNVERKSSAALLEALAGLYIRSHQSLEMSDLGKAII